MRKSVIGKWLRLCLLFLAVASLTAISGCGSGSGTATFNISGDWNVFYTTTGGPAEQGPFVFNFSQSDPDLSGTTSQGTSISGTIKDTTVNFDFDWTDAVSTVTSHYTFEGTVGGASGDVMTGTWTNTAAQSGTWRATFILQ